MWAGFKAKGKGPKRPRDRIETAEPTAKAPTNKAEEPNRPEPQAGDAEPHRADCREDIKELRRPADKMEMVGPRRAELRARSAGPKLLQSATGSRDTKPTRAKPTADREESIRACCCRSKVKPACSISGKGVSGSSLVKLWVDVEEPGLDVAKGKIGLPNRDTPSKLKPELGHAEVWSSSEEPE